MIDNFINGNLREAKRQARQFSGNAIFEVLHNFYGYSIKKANLTAHYLKHPSQATFQAACDVK